MTWINLDPSTSAAEVPGGCLVRHFALCLTIMHMSIAFVPGVQIIVPEGCRYGVLQEGATP